MTQNKANKKKLSPQTALATAIVLCFIHLLGTGVYLFLSYLGYENTESLGAGVAFIGVLVVIVAILHVLFSLTALSSLIMGRKSKEVFSVLISSYVLTTAWIPLFSSAVALLFQVPIFIPMVAMELLAAVGFGGVVAGISLSRILKGESLVDNHAPVVERQTRLT